MTCLAAWCYMYMYIVHVLSLYNEYSDHTCLAYRTSEDSAQGNRRASVSFLCIHKVRQGRGTLNIITKP